MLKSMVQGQTRKRLDIQRIAQIKSAARVLRSRPDLWRTAFAMDPDFVFALLQ
jgi:hypothetical protein